MITAKIQITPYLAEFLVAKMNNFSWQPFAIPANTDLYHLVWELMARRPAGLSPNDRGNISIILPHRRLGKDPLYFNYLSPKSQLIINKHIKALFDLELHSALCRNIKNGRPLNDLDVVHQFMCNYAVESVSEDALIKNFYRWRRSCLKKNSKKNTDHKPHSVLQQ
jgi:hypothetical protein